MKKITLILLPILLCSCTSKYELQLEKYNSVIGEKFIYYMNRDENLNEDSKEMYFNLIRETNEMIYK